MLVKQVFSRAMGVWIFAVALLVGEVSCEKVDLELVNNMYAQIKIWSMNFSAYRMKLMRRNHKPMYTVKEDMNPISQILLGIKEIDDKISSDVKNGGLLANLYNINLGYNPQLYKSTNEIFFMGQTLPHPFQASLVKLVRVETFGGALETVLCRLKPYFDRAHSEFTKTEVSDMISILGELPVLEEYGSDAYLPKETVGVSWTEVTNLVSEMEKILRGFVPTDDVLNKDAVLNEDAVIVNFLQLKENVINSSIITHVNWLFGNSLFFRLAVSEVHTVYISDNPKALLYTRFLQETLRKLSRFVNWLATLWAQGHLTGTSTSAYAEGMVLHLRRLDDINEYLDPSVVYDLKQVLDHGLDGYILSNDAEHDPIYKFPRVFAEFEAMSRFFRTFAPIKERVMSAKMLNNIDASKHRSHLKLLVAFTDERFKALIAILESSALKQMCGVEDEPISATWGFVVKTTLIDLCVLRYRARKHGPLEPDASLFGLLMITFPGFGFSVRANLKLCEFGTPHIKLQEPLVGWENWLTEGLDEFNTKISAHKFNIE